MSQKKSEKKQSGNDKKGKRRLGGKLASFWRKRILRKKDNDDSSTSTKTASVSSDEKTKLTAEAATSGLHLDKKTREHVTKVIASEMKRRHLERERRRKELIASTQARLPWGKKEPGKHVCKTPASGETVYPIKMVPTAEVQSEVYSSRDEAVSADLEDSEQPIAVFVPPPTQSSSSKPEGLSLEERRRKWIQQQTSARKKNVQSAAKNLSSGQSMMLAGPPVSTSAEASSGQEPMDMTDAFGSQPMELHLDDSTVQEIHSHTFEKIIESIVQESIQKEAAAKQVEVKEPQEMSPDELVELLKSDPNAWDQLTRQNTVVSFGMTAPTDDEKGHGKQTKKIRRPNVISFEPEIDVVGVPVGKDFNVNEKKDVTTSALKK